METILEVKNLGKTFPIRNFIGRTKGGVSAVDRVSFSLGAQGTLGIVGESGCGKSTLARLLMRLIEPDTGEVNYRDRNILSLSGGPLKEVRRQIQMVFQNPYSSLDPQMTVLDNVAFSLWANGSGKAEARQAAYEYLDAVGLSRTHADRMPGSLSGGQRQRVAIARALILKPEIVIADEAVSALDKSVQAQVLNLFQDLKKEFALSLIFISHDLHVVEYMSDEVMVMYLGRVVEKGPTERIFGNPAHPYTRALLASAPSLDVEHAGSGAPALAGELPSPLNPPSGCRFRTRCPLATERCARETPALTEVGPGHQAACLLIEESKSA
ncbi:ABC transporter ATP-binding protein [Cohnella zeiphila]|uniref:Glutathione import ATP-binding protein GsiA n=1 Tax=Cohnella zeiphila TaxID=2761120 RepID=A0A7X0SSM3_9BACL|nr:oligopeptide/dipeptide ABC transporter ATP-binding protein [Cohnella zeiphila]MBB6735395.1 ATP-binding cassette domain-containing protein [Cohnella zeiphila]